MREVRDRDSSSRSKKRRNYKSGDIVRLFVDYQGNKEEIGRARLVTFISKGLTFILPDNDNIVYNTERWVAEIITSTHPKHPKGMVRNYRIRYVEKIGQPDKTEDKESETFEIIDSFLTFNGVELY